MKSKGTIIQNLFNAFGWHTKRKIILFESDDWGSIRVPSSKVKGLLLDKGIRLNSLSYNCYDSLASEEDLVFLFDVLLKVKDIRGNPAKFTVNTVVANPDFDKIKESNFTKYYFEPFTVTLKRYPEHQKSFELWKEGMAAGVFKPQFHGREHLNVTRWMEALYNNSGHTRLAFDYRMFDLSTSLTPSENSFMEALNYIEHNELRFHQNSLIEGTELFEKIFGYKSTSFIAPCYMWSNDLNHTLRKCGIRVFQGGIFQFQPTGGRFKKAIHYTGQKNALGQYFLVRNVSFEPSENPSFDWVGSALSQIANAFLWHTPAIISTHRMNYIGYIDPENRQRNLTLLGQLLKTIKRRWPDVEFMSSDQLGYLIQSHRD